MTVPFPKLELEVLLAMEAAKSAGAKGTRDHHAPPCAAAPPAEAPTVRKTT